MRRLYLFDDRTSAATMRVWQLRRWFIPMACTLTVPEAGGVPHLAPR